jgi:hypothetical protein
MAPRLVVATATLRLVVATTTLGLIVTPAARLAVTASRSIVVVIIAAAAAILDQQILAWLSHDGGRECRKRISAR